MHKGNCLCGAVKIHVTGHALNSRYCHCQQCQKATSAPFFARVLFYQDDVKITGPIKYYSSSPELDRVFCSQCGSSIAACRKDKTVIGIAITMFENTNIFPPTEHIWVSEKVGWTKLEDGLKQYDKGHNNEIPHSD